MPKAGKAPDQAAWEQVVAEVNQRLKEARETSDSPSMALRRVDLLKRAREAAEKGSKALTTLNPFPQQPHITNRVKLLQAHAESIRGGALPERIDVNAHQPPKKQLPIAPAEPKVQPVTFTQYNTAFARLSQRADSGDPSAADEILDLIDRRKDTMQQERALPSELRRLDEEAGYWRRRSGRSRGW